MVSEDALSQGHGQHTEGPINVAGEAVSVLQKQPDALPGAIPVQQADGHFVWAAEQQEPRLVHGHLEAVGKPSLLRGRWACGHPPGTLAKGGSGQDCPLVLRNSCCGLAWEVDEKF